MSKAETLPPQGGRVREVNPPLMRPSETLSPNMENPTQPTSEATTATHNPFKPDLSRVSAEYLARELYRRQRAGECLVMILTPEDIAEYFECDESGATHPGSRVPEAEEMRGLARAFDRWQDNGSYSDLMDTLRRAWQGEQARQLDQEGGAR